MTTERWHQVVEMFSAAVDRSPDRRQAYLDEACADDPDLRAHVEDFLANDAIAETEGFLKDPPWVIDELPVLLPDFGEYKQIEYVGHGGMGVVYKAFDESLDTHVALKMSLPRRLTTTEDISRFRIDPRSMAKLKHTNIVQVFKVGECDGKPYFTMNLIEREDGSVGLEKHLAQFRDDPAAAVRLLVKVARAVHHAHQRRILHRDLKPGNILLDDEENPYVTDFGLAKQIGKDERLTETGEPLTPTSVAYRGILGTASYMPPEQADTDPDREVTTLSDVYGLGATLYALLTGRPPFQADTVEETLQLVRDRRRKPQPPRRVNRRLDWTLPAICLKSLEKHPDQRYRSAEGLAKDLERWMRHEPTGVPQPFRVRFWNWCRRNPGAAALTMATAALLVMSVVMANLAAIRVESTLVEAASESNTIAAGRVADNIRWLLRDLGTTVVKAANDEEVRTFLNRMKGVETREEVLRSLEAKEGVHFHNAAKALFDEANKDLRELGIPEFATMFFLNEGGRLIDIVATTEGDSSVRGELFNGRDYFLGAKRNLVDRWKGLDAVHISRVFKSEFDGLYKFAVSVAVIDDDGSFLGVIEASIPMHHTLGLEEQWIHDKVALVGRVVSKPPREGGTQPDHKYQFLLHEAFKDKPALREEMVAFSGRPWRDADPELPELNPLPRPPMEPEDDYRDPLEERDPYEYGGRWLAGFAPVGNTELMVIVQQRYDEAVGQPTSLAWTFVLWGWGALAMGSILTGALVWYRSRRPVEKESR